MKSEDIKTMQDEVVASGPSIEYRELRIVAWEIAYQLAVMNEARPKPSRPHRTADDFPPFKPDWFATIQARDLAKKTDSEQG